MMDDTAIRATDNELVQRYTTRLAMFGDDPRSLGWDTKANQNRRFAVATELYDFSGKSVLDVGCGLAHFRRFLFDNDIAPCRYTGIDINADLLARCRDEFPSDRFVHGNVLLDPLDDAPFDVVVAFGIVNFRFPRLDPAEYGRRLLERTFALAHDTAIVDALSAVRDEAYPLEPQVFYHNPVEWLQFALSLTPFVTLRQDYPSIPQRELMMAMRRRPT